LSFAIVRPERDSKIALIASLAQVDMGRTTYTPRDPRRAFTGSARPAATLRLVMYSDGFTFVVVEQTLPDGITLPEHRRARAAQRRPRRRLLIRLRRQVARLA
jgi:hypothetical protein